MRNPPVFQLTPSPPGSLQPFPSCIASQALNSFHSITSPWSCKQRRPNVYTPAYSLNKEGGSFPNIDISEHHLEHKQAELDAKLTQVRPTRRPSSKRTAQRPVLAITHASSHPASRGPERDKFEPWPNLPYSH